MRSAYILMLQSPRSAVRACLLRSVLRDNGTEDEIDGRNDDNGRKLVP